MDAFWLRVALHEASIGLGLAPQLDRPLQEPASRRRAIFLDRLLDSRKPLGCVGSIEECHSITVLRTDRRNCSRLHSSARPTAAILPRPFPPANHVCTTEQPFWTAPATLAVAPGRGNRFRKRRADVRTKWRSSSIPEGPKTQVASSPANSGADDRTQEQEEGERRRIRRARPKRHDALHGRCLARGISRHARRRRSHAHRRLRRHSGVVNRCRTGHSIRNPTRASVDVILRTGRTAA